MRATYDRLTEAYQSEAEDDAVSWMISPSSSARVFWDVLGMVLVTYDLIFMPLQLFDPPWTGLAVAMGWVTRLFWTLDLVASFVSGYIKPNGTIEMEPRKVAVNYFSSWFLLDVIIITSDWMELAATDKHTAWSIVLIGRASRTVRLIRLVRLLRLMRVRGVLRVLCERIQSETLSLLANIVQILIMLTALAHLIACIWYGVGDSEAPATWVKAHELEDKTLWYRYTIALHWSLQQFGGGTDEIVPYNVGERVFAIGVFVLGFASSAFFVSSLTSSMTQLYIITSQNTRRLSALKRWMRDANISSLLAMRVLRNAQHATLEEQRFMPEAKVELLHLVSEPLRVELHFEMYSPVLDLHPFFQMYRAECPQVVRRICHDAVGWFTVSRGDVVFHAGESPTVRNMYFTENDSMQYAPISGGFLKVLPHQWVAEAVLWIADWSHVGTLMALCNTSLTALNAEKFQDIASIFNHDLFDPKVYATQFVMAFNRQGHNTMDTPLPDDEMDNIMQVLATLVAAESAAD